MHDVSLQLAREGNIISNIIGNESLSQGCTTHINFEFYYIVIKFKINVSSTALA